MTAVLVICVGLGSMSLPAAAGAPGPANATASSARAIPAPGGTVVGNRTYFPDGSVLVSNEPGTFSLSQCDSGQFCIWTSTGYTGSFTYKTGSGVTRSISTSVGSFYNNRARAARLYSNTGSSSTCYAAGAQRSSVSSSYSSADSVYLSSTTSC